MSTVSRVLNHSVFHVERYGDALVVCPQGDAIGFSPNRIQVELRAIEKMLGEPENRHLIVDLHRTTYFGSDMIGHISRLGIKGRQKGGRLALCEVSADMEEIFNMMHFEQMWETFDSRKQALRAIAAVPVSEKLRPLRKYVIGAIAIAALIVAAIYYPWPSKDKRRFDLFISYANKWQQLQKGDKDSTDRGLFRKRVQRDLKPIMVDLAAEEMLGSESAKYLHAAATQGLLPLLYADSMDRRLQEDNFVEYMAEAAKLIPGAAPPSYETFGRRMAIRRGSHETAERITEVQTH